MKRYHPQFKEHRENWHRSAIITKDEISKNLVGKLEPSSLQTRVEGYQFPEWKIKGRDIRLGFTLFKPMVRRRIDTIHSPKSPSLDLFLTSAQDRYRQALQPISMQVQLYFTSFYPRFLKLSPWSSYCILSVILDFSIIFIIKALPTLFSPETNTPRHSWVGPTSDSAFRGNREGVCELHCIIITRLRYWDGSCWGV